MVENTEPKYDAPVWLKMKEAMVYLDVSNSFLYKLINAGQVKAYRYGGKAGQYKFKKTDLDAFIEKNRVVVNDDTQN